MLTEEAEASVPALAAAVSVKLPPFWPADPEVWFAQVEVQFTTKGITPQKTKFDYVISSLGPEFATEVRDLLLKPPAEQPYDKLRTQLIKLQQLISGEELGDRKPTQLLRRMRQLLGDKLGGADANSFLRQLFLQRLPANVQMVLAPADASMELEQLADMADKVMEVATPTVSAASDIHTVAAIADNSEVRQLREEISRLASLVDSLITRPRRCDSSRQRRSASPALPTSSQDTLCWYHAKFGENAKRCKQPCTWDLNSQARH